MRAAVGFAEDGDGLDAELAAGADDPQGDFTAVGDQNALEHRRRSEAGAQNCNTAHWRTFTLNSGWPNSTGVVVLDEHGGDLTRDLGGDLVEDLHGLDDANDTLRPHVVSDLHERRRFGVGSGVEGAHHGAFDFLHASIIVGGCRGGRRSRVLRGWHVERARKTASGNRRGPM